jgi:outer membrane immunogenic protein
MRSLAAAIAAICLSASGAFAQSAPWDQVEKKWHSGAYVGATVGYSASALNTAGPIDWAASGALGGILAGYGTTTQGGLYLGIEIDGVLKDVKWSVTDGGTTVSAANKWVGSGRVRVGQAIGPALLYATGGIAVTDQTVKASGFGSTSDMRFGWVAGAGIEAAITQTMVLRLEGLHYDFSDKAVTLGGLSERIGSGDNVIRGAITFKVF